MTKIKSYLGNQCLTSIYYSLVYPYLIYGCLLWRNSYDNLLSPLIRLQNNAVRIMIDVPLLDHITPHNVHLGLYNCFCMIMSLIISHAILHYFLYLSNIIILHEVHLLNYYTFPTQELIFESFALPSLENTIGMISPFLFAKTHQNPVQKGT